MDGADQLAEFYVSTPRASSDLTGRSGDYGAVDAALNELEVPAALDEDGDWTLETDVGSLALIIDDVTGDLVAIQPLHDMESIDSPDFMHALLRLNFEARGLARCGAITQSGKDIFVISARVAGAETSTETVGRLLSDCMRFSRRILELLEEARGGAAEPEPAPAEPEAAEPEPPAEPAPGAADVTAFAAVPSGPPPAEPHDEPEPAPAPEAPPTDEPVAAPSAPTVFSQPIPDGPPPSEPAAAEPTAAGEGEPGPWGPPSAEPTASDPAPWGPPSAEPAPPEPAPQEPPSADPPPEYPPPQYAPPQPELPPANWYPDPHGLARLRYWDGQQWTEHVAQ